MPLMWPAGKVLRLPVRLLSLLPHRGPPHSVLACALVAVACGVAVRLVDPALAPAAAVGVAIGYGGHLAADACTPSGVPLWAPFSGRRRLSLTTCRSVPPRAAPNDEVTALTSES